MVPAEAARSGRAMGNPVQKAMELLSGLQAKLLRQGETSTKVYDEFADWCKTKSRASQQAMQRLKADQEDQKAAIEKASDEVDSLGTKVEELSSRISTDESDLKAATLIRNKEAGDFAKVQKDLIDTIDTIERAVKILEKEVKSGSFTQVDGLPGLTQALSTLVEASALGAADSSRLTALVQQAAVANSNSDDEETAPPDAKAYASHSDVIIETLETFQEKAEAQLEEARRIEANQAGNYGVLKTSLEDKLEYANKNMAKAKKAMAEAGQAKANAEGDLAATTKDLKDEIQEIGELHHNCMSKAADYEEEMKERGQELAALAKAKQVIAELTGGATQQTYSLAQGQAAVPADQAPSFLQVEEEAGSEAEGDVSDQAVRMVKQFARETNSKALTQLSYRLDSALQMAAVNGADPFGKVRILIKDMIASLQNEANAEAEHKAWCDHEMGEATKKKSSKEAEIEKLTTKLDELSSRLTNLAEEVATLQKELSELARSQAEMTRIRDEEHQLFLQQKGEMEEGIKGVKVALKTLRDYYAQGDGKPAGRGDSSGSNIIGILEIVESDFSKGLSELVAVEDAADKVFRQESTENEVSRKGKESDVQYKSKQLKADDKTSSELNTDKDGAQAELTAVGEYLTRLEHQCVGRAEPYEERRQRRQKEINGLKEAWDLLSSRAPALMQVSSHKQPGHHLRGVRDF